MNVTEQLMTEEGVRRSAYQDHLGYWTIGVGRLIDARKGGGLSPDEVQYLLANDVRRCESAVRGIVLGFAGLNEPRRAVLVGMAFQLGVAGLAGFKNTIAMIERGDYAGAAANMLKSKWASQTPGRAARMAKQMETGEWQSIQ
jgi:lysozyme